MSEHLEEEATGGDMTVPARPPGPGPVLVSGGKECTQDKSRTWKQKQKRKIEQTNMVSQV